MDSDDGDSNTNTELYDIYIFFKAYSRRICNVRGRAFLRFKKARI